MKTHMSATMRTARTLTRLLPTVGRRQLIEVRTGVVALSHREGQHTVLLQPGRPSMPGRHILDRIAAAASP
jgi:hypothetical protein